MTTILSGTSLLAAGRELAPLIRDHSVYSDEHGKLAPEVVDAFHDTGLFGMWVPRALGGAELDPLSALELVEQVSYEDAAAGWVLFATGVGTATAGIYLPDEGAAEVWGGERSPVLAGQGTRAGKAVRVDGGYRLTGSWNFASGSQHASHILTLGVTEDHEALLFILPVEEVTLIDNWDVLGLHGTGSFDYEIDDVFVPDSRTCVAGAEVPLRGGPACRLGLVQTAMIGHSGWAMGVGRRLLDELSALVRQKAGRPHAQADSDSFHEQFANAEAMLRGAGALLRESWSDAWDTLQRDEDLSKRQGTLIRLALNHATWTAHKVGTFVYAAGGSDALRSGDLQRFYRDLHGGTQHIMSGAPVLRHCGRELAGLAENQHWFYTDMVDDA